MPGLSELRQFTINGVLSTKDSVLTNMNNLASSCGCWITYDIHAGKWSVIINEPGTSEKSFDDSNIIGSITLQGTGLNELYNSVRVTYPRGDINDEIDWVQVDLPAQDRNYNEPDNALEMNLPMTNDPVQAELIGLIELKQNRVDQLISFQTDYTSIDLNAGDIIDVTNNMLGFTNKLFRILTMRETDGDDGSIRIEITALEYDADVYANDLFRYERTNSNGITSIGAIGVPNTPTINVFNRDSRPRVVLNAVTPTGLVNGVEFWLSTSSSTTGFDLVSVQRPQTSTFYAAGTAVTADIDNINSGNIWVKVRAFNADIDGPFSAVVTQAFAPVQVTNAVDPDTAITDINGNLLTSAILTTLLQSLDGLYSNNSSAGGSLFSKIFEIFDTVTGVDILGDIGNIQTGAEDSFTTIVAGGNTLSGATSGLVTFVAGSNVTISGSSFSNEITIDAVGGGGGGGSNAFGTVIANGTSLVADTTSDTLTISAGSNVTITANSGSDTLTIDTQGLWQGSRKFVSATAPVSPSNGDIWFEI